MRVQAGMYTPRGGLCVCADDKGCYVHRHADDVDCMVVSVFARLCWSSGYLLKHKNTEIRHCQVCGKLFGRDGRCGSRRCTARNVRARKQRAEDGLCVISVHHRAADLHMQAAAVLCATVGISASQCHMLTRADHKLVERVYGSLRSVVAAKVVELQASINLNSLWSGLTVRLTRSPSAKRRRVKAWSSGPSIWASCGGDEGSHHHCPTIARAPGPRPLRTEEWLDVGRPLLEDKRIILHTDSAKVYVSVFKTMRHTRVVHMKKKVDGKWLQPK
eukprot:736828-Amphidinium_carterae.2